jgi:hypothetical protein
LQAFNSIIVSVSMEALESNCHFILYFSGTDSRVEIDLKDFFWMSAWTWKIMRIYLRIFSFERQRINTVVYFFEN